MILTVYFPRIHVNFPDHRPVKHIQWFDKRGLTVYNIVNFHRLFSWVKISANRYNLNIDRILRFQLNKARGTTVRSVDILFCYLI